MKTIIHLSKGKILLFFFLITSLAAFAQNLVRYPLTSNLNPAEGPAPGMQIPGVDLIKYIDPPTQIIPTNYTYNYLNFDNNNDEVVLTFDGTNYQGMSVQFKAGIGVFFAAASGNIKVWLKIGTGTETLLDNHNFSATFFGEDTYNFTLPLTAADNQSLIQIRIVGTSSTFGWLSYFGIKNLRIASNNTTMSVRRDISGSPNISYEALASVSLDTDFGSLLTNEQSEDKVYRITNTGGRILTINSIITSPGTEGFSILGAIPTTIAIGGYSTFTVRFAPVNQGLKEADIEINSNALPNNPFRFQVKGNGKSCNLDPVPVSFYNFEPTGSNLPVTLIGGNPGLTGANSNSPNPTTLGTALFPSNTNLYSSGSSSRSLFVRGNSTPDQNGVAGTGDVTLEFGPLDLTGQQEVSVNFDVAAFGSTSNNSGVNGYDYVLLSVKRQNGTWSDEIRLNGSSGSSEWDARTFKYGFGMALIPESTFDGTLYSVNNTLATKYGEFKLNIPASELTSNFTFRIKARSGRTRTGSFPNYSHYNRNVWLIDNVHVDAGNAKVKTWGGTSWADGSPSPRDKAKFTGNYDFSAGENFDLKICGCEVANGVNFTIPGGRTLEVQNSIINNGDGSNFVVASDANLLQLESGAVNTGNITVERSVTDMDNIPSKMDYVYWSSPVANQNLHAFSPGTPAANFLQYKEATDFFVTTYDGVFHPAKGYAIRAETSGVSSPSYEKTYQFVGVPNNGDYPVLINRSPDTGLVVHGYNLIGNPYPSNIDFDKLYDGNSTKIFKTAWFWTNDFDNPPQQGSEYDGTNYVVYNGTGGSTPAANGIIKVGQGFLIQNKGSENSSTFLNFQNSYGKNNVLRVNTPGRFYQKESSPRNRFWLKLVSPDDMVNSQLIGYIEGATDEFEQDYDAEIMGMSSDIFYSKLDDKRLLIQGKGAFDTTDKVNLGANFFKAGTYTLALDIGDGIFSGSQKVYLKDNETGTLTDLSVNQYTFQAAQGISEGRFEVIYEPQQVLLTEDIAADNLIVYRDGGDFVVRAQSINISDLEVYDGSGRLIYKTQPRHTEVRIPGDKLLRGVYILKIDQNGQLTKKKILK